MESSPDVLSGATTPPSFEEASTELKTTCAAELHLSGAASVSSRPSSSEDQATQVRNGPRHKLSKLLKGKEREWTAVAEKKGPLRLLDLPVDILKEVINQLPHTNDLTSLALCHSALHSLTIPCIYSRFDIVWPDSSPNIDTRSGVDALTYGLATLVKSDVLFGESPSQRAQQEAARRSRASLSKSNSNGRSQRQQSPELYPLPKRRYGNYYAQFVKKFSLGNGPSEWVQEYLISKEGGKMLGTLVAMVIAQMRNLETFVWDMPTGILRDVWLALSSLADREDGEECRLEKLWVRWHDNTQTNLSLSVPPPPPLPGMTNVPPHTVSASGAGAVQSHTVISSNHTLASAPLMDRVEHPNFSVIPALKSLSVLNIDELSYLDEMSILIARSKKKLRELRVGIARHAQQRDWVAAWEGDGIQQVDYSTTHTAASNIGEKRLGGVLGILVGRVYNMRQDADVPAQERSYSQRERLVNADSGSGKNDAINDGHTELPLSTSEHNPANISLSNHMALLSLMDGTATMPESEDSHLESESPINWHSSEQASLGTGAPASNLPRNDSLPAQSRPGYEHRNGPSMNGTLKLETLELERVPLSVSVLQRAFDWSALTNLTLLQCQNHEQLWKSLRRIYSPRSGSMSCSGGSHSPPFPKAFRSSYNAPVEYRLGLKKIHTNCVSPSLMAFLRETLAPNSLEVLFLQEGRTYVSSVTIDTIFRAIKRHRSSIKKLLIDSGEKTYEGLTISSTRWRRWMFNREILTFITSGRMESLRELAVSIEYRDWHIFLQRLPMIPHLRSLHIPYIADHPHGANVEGPKELALQILDIVTLRPEIELCYMGLSTKCFEILENKPQSHDGRHNSDSSLPPANLPHVYSANHPLLIDDEDDEEEDPDEDEDDIDGTATGITPDDDTETEISDDLHDDSEDDVYSNAEEKKAPRLRLREILFYDDKVAIFKARHGRL